MLPTFCPYGAWGVVGLPGAVAWGQILHFLFLDEKKQKSRLCIVLNAD
jgi:hypothetical protein